MYYIGKGVKAKIIKNYIFGKKNWVSLEPDVASPMGNLEIKIVEVYYILWGFNEYFKFKRLSWFVNGFSPFRIQFLIKMFNLRWSDLLHLTFYAFDYLYI